MSLGTTSVQRPVLAIVASLFIVIVGGLAYLGLPISEYPDVVPPTIVVSTTYPGASAQTVADTVATPIEQEVNGVEHMLYMYSQATSNGDLSLTITFKPGTDLDKAQVLVQNRVAVALSRLPEPVQHNGVTTNKASPNILCGMLLFSPDGSRSPLFVSNYATGRVADVLKRLEGIGDIYILGSREYSMRVWIDPERAANYGLTAEDLLSAIRSQNIQVAGGIAGQPPISGSSFQPNLIFDGRLKEPGQFEDIIVKAEGGRLVRLRDVARVEIGALTYDTAGFVFQRPAVALELLQRPGTNAIATVQQLLETMARMKRTEFPSGVDYSAVYNPTGYIIESIKELVKTSFQAIILVVLVILVFLRGWRPSLIAILAMPVSLVGTFAVMSILHLSINYLTMFGLVLAVGIVVDDAIVVVENTARHIEAGKTPKEAAVLTMQEVGGALFGIALTLCAVFVPTAFVPGLSGQFFRHFGITIAAATAISCFCSLTLSPALAYLILRQPTSVEEAQRGRMGWLHCFFVRAGNRFEAGFRRLSDFYGHTVSKLIEITPMMLGIYGLLIAATLYMLSTTQQGFIPAQDRGYLIVVIQLPGGAAFERTEQVAHVVEKIALSTPGVRAVPGFIGLSAVTQTLAPNAATAFVVLTPSNTRLRKGQSSEWIAAQLRKKLSAVTDAVFVVVAPPPVPGLGSTSGFSLRLEDRAGLGPQALAKATNDLVAAANATPGMRGVYTTFNASAPQVKIDVNHAQAEMLGVSVQSINEAIETYFGSTYINDFNINGRTYHVTAQADLPFRTSAEALARLRVRNSNGDMVPIGNVLSFQDMLGPDRVPRYNLYPASEISGDTEAAKGSEFAVKTMEKLAAKVLPSGVSYEWTDLSYQQTTGGNAGLLVFPLCVAFVYLVLAALYGSWTLPISILLIVPMCLLAATAGVRIMGLDLNVLTQIGFIVLIGLAAKNAILIVEFARRQEMNGKERITAVIEACRLRLRPILMTSFAFILGVFPLIISDGAGSEMRKAVGTSVFFGMIGVTLFGLIFTPIFYVLVRNLSEGRAYARAAKPLRDQEPEGPREAAVV
jgi:multidrug efflux pump